MSPTTTPRPSKPCRQAAGAPTASNAHDVESIAALAAGPALNTDGHATVSSVIATTSRCSASARIATGVAFAISRFTITTLR